MRRMAATLLLLLAVTPGLAVERGPVCRETSVVDEISRQVRAGGYYADVDPRLVTEQPTAGPALRALPSLCDGRAVRHPAVRRSPDRAVHVPRL
jgi:hypothetical protein